MSYKQIRGHFKDFQTVCELGDLNLDLVSFGNDFEQSWAFIFMQGYLFLSVLGMLLEINMSKYFLLFTDH